MEIMDGQIMDGSKLKINWIKMEIKIIQSFFYCIICGI